MLVLEGKLEILTWIIQCAYVLSSTAALRSSAIGLSALALLKGFFDGLRKKDVDFEFAMRMAKVENKDLGKVVLP